MHRLEGQAQAQPNLLKSGVYSSIAIDGRTYPLNQCKQTLPPIHLIRWLEDHPLYPKVFWKDRDGQTTYAAVGNLFSFPHVPRFSGATHLELRLYGGIRFSEKYHREDTTWRGFPKTCFWLPQIELSQQGEMTEATTYSLHERPCLDAELFAIKTPSPQHFKTHTLLNRIDTPTFKTWQDNVDQALKAISSGTIDKLVLARRTMLQFSQPLSIGACLSHLVHHAQSATLFAFQLSPSLCFLGATPEKLFERTGCELNTDVIAGTQPRGSTFEEDALLERALLHSGKDRHEFSIVKRFLQQAISPFSKEMKWDGQDQILKTSHVQHIHNRLKATLKGEVFDEELIKALHPTPALGGYPKEKADLLLQEIEPFDRGWYGGVVGMISPKSANLHVAIRSALIRESSLHLFAGTGIVQGSHAEREWEELEQKIRLFIELFLN